MDRVVLEGVGGSLVHGEEVDDDNVTYVVGGVVAVGHWTGYDGHDGGWRHEVDVAEITLS